MLLLFLLPLAWAQDPEKTCLSSECVALSKRYRSHMKVDVDPCEDFYEYACGNYPTQHHIPEHAERFTVLQEMQTFLDNQFIELLKDTSYLNISRHLWSAKYFYDSCMNEEARERFGKDPIRHLIIDLGGWDLLDGATFNEATFQWEKLFGNILHHGVFYVFKPFVLPSINNTAEHLLMLNRLEPFFINDDEYQKDYENSTQLQFHRQYILKMLGILGVTMGSETEDRVDNLIAFEKSLATIESGFAPIILTYGVIKQRFNNIKWDLIFNQDIKNDLGGVDDSTKIEVLFPTYFDQLNKLLTSTPKREIYDYLFWRLVADYIPHLPDKYQEPLKEFNTKVFGASKVAPLKERCATETRIQFDFPLAAAFADKYFNKEDKNKVKELAYNLKNAMKVELEKAEWLDENDRQKLMNKLKLMKSKLVYPEFIFDPHHLEKRYGGLYLTQEHYFANVISLRKAVQRYNFKVLQHEVGYDWELGILQTNPGYRPLYNEFELGVGGLHYPFFILNSPPFINYGAIGAVVAHEILHGFDTKGRLFDEKGNIRNWLSEETVVKLLNKAVCFLDQYGREIEPITNKKLNGRHTWEENVADNGGVRLAYQAYRKELEEKNNIKGLPDFQDFSSDKMFFIAYANNFCVASKKDAIAYYIENDGHSFETYRVNIPLRNFPEFSKAYNCQKGKMMYNPVNTCRVW